MRVDITRPRFDQSTYWGRAKHFFITTNPLNVLKTSSELEAAKAIVDRCLAYDAMPDKSDDEIWHAKHIYDSAYHPDSGELMLLPCRMSFQVPGNMLITGSMLQFYKTTPAVIFWQWFNQTFNAGVNYTNANKDTEISKMHLLTVYALATTGAVATALGINRMIHRFPPLFSRFVPFVAVAAANCINLPSMRSQELIEGIPVFDDDGNRVGKSKAAAKLAISQVLLSRIGMAVPGMILPPLVMNALEKRGALARRGWIGAPLQILLCGLCLTFTTPMCCALFPQRSSIAVNHVERDLQVKLRHDGTLPHARLYFNKGL